jgi:quercetin dioxygenase-like cupin family protein
MLRADDTIVLDPEAGTTVHLGGVGVILKVLSEQTGGALSIVEHPVTPWTLVPPHVHRNEDEISYVLEGEFGVRVGDQVLRVTPGCYVFKPRNVPHTFWNPSPAPARLIEIITPAGFERFFPEMAALIPPEGLPDFEEVGKLADRYGVSFEDWAPALMAQYNLKLLGR